MLKCVNVGKFGSDPVGPIKVSLYLIPPMHFDFLYSLELILSDIF